MMLPAMVIDDDAEVTECYLNGYRVTRNGRSRLLGGLLAEERRAGTAPAFVERDARNGMFARYYRASAIKTWLAERRLNPLPADSEAPRPTAVVAELDRLKAGNGALSAQLHNANKTIAVLRDEIARLVEPSIDGLLSRSELLSMSEPYVGRNTGVYFLIDSGEIVYVGKSVDVRCRIAAHRAENRKFTHFSFVACEPEHLDGLERRYIRALAPPLNIRFVEPAADPAVAAAVAELRQLARNLGELTPDHHRKPVFDTRKREVEAALRQVAINLERGRVPRPNRVMGGGGCDASARPA